MTSQSSPDIELLPCPFCGGEADNYPRQEAVFNMSWVAHTSHCKSCQARVSSTDEGNSIAMWNTRTTQPARSSAGIEDDPTASTEWNAGCDFALTELCTFLGVDPQAVTWDAATETVDGDVRAVIGNILSAKYGEDWGPNDPAQARQVTDEMVEAGAIGLTLDVADHDGGPSFYEMSEQSQHEARIVSRACLTAALSVSSTQQLSKHNEFNPETEYPGTYGALSRPHREAP